MSELMVIAFPGDREGASRASATLESAGDTGVISPDDAIVTEVDEKGRLHVHQAFALTGSGVAEGALLGSVLGFALTIPFGVVGSLVMLVAVLAGAGIGAGAGGWIGHHRDYGIPDEVAESLGSTLAPDSSALFILLPAGQVDAARNEFDACGGEISTVTLDETAEAKLHAAMAEAHKRGGAA